MNEHLLTSQQVANRLAISIRTLWRLVKSGAMPAPIRFNRKLVRWKADEIAEAVEAFRNQPPFAPRPKTWSTAK